MATDYNANLAKEIQKAGKLESFELGDMTAGYSINGFGDSGQYRDHHGDWKGYTNSRITLNLNIDYKTTGSKVALEFGRTYNGLVNQQESIFKFLKLYQSALEFKLHEKISESFNWKIKPLTNFSAKVRESGGTEPARLFISCKGTLPDFSKLEKIQKAKSLDEANLLITALKQKLGASFEDNQLIIEKLLPNSISQSLITAAELGSKSFKNQLSHKGKIKSAEEYLTNSLSAKEDYKARLEEFNGVKDELEYGRYLLEARNIFFKMPKHFELIKIISDYRQGGSDYEYPLDKKAQEFFDDYHINIYTDQPNIFKEIKMGIRPGNDGNYIINPTEDCNTAFWPVQICNVEDLKLFTNLEKC